MAIFAVAAEAVILAFVEMHVRAAPVRNQPVRQAASHVHGPRLVLRAMAEKKRTVEALDLDWRGRHQVFRGTAPGPGPLSRVPGLPTRVSGISPPLAVEGSTNDVRRGMRSDRVGDT